MSINRVTLTGNLTRDPELRSTTNGTGILVFGIAVNDRRRNPQTGEWEDYPNFIDCVVYGARATSLQRFISKGSKVAIEGKLRYSSWESKEGQRRSRIEVVVDDLEFMSARRTDDQAQGTYQQVPSYSAPGGQTAPQSIPTQTSPEDVFDEDIPF